MVLTTATLTALALGLAAAAWRQVRTLFNQAAGLLLVRATIGRNLMPILEGYLEAEFRRSPWGPRTVDTFGDYVRPWGRYGPVPFERVGAGTAVYRRGWRPLALAGTGGGTEGRIAFVRGVFRLDDLVIAAVDWERRRREDAPGDARHRRFCVEHARAGGNIGQAFADDAARPRGDGVASRPPDLVHQHARLVGLARDQVGMPMPPPGEAFASLALDAAALAAVADARRWHDSRDWHADRGVPWKLGWLLHGAPGCGKTSLARAVAQDLDLPVYVLDLASMDNRDLQFQWAKLREAAPCMILIEDIDAAFRGRENIAAGAHGGGMRPPLTFDCLLNCIDGVENTDGQFLIVTTNHVESLDPALGSPTAAGGSTRPGRINRVVELGPPDAAGRRLIAGRILRGHPALINDAVRQGDGMSAAQFQELCRDRALREFWLEDTP